MAKLLMFVLLFVGWVGEWPLELDSILYSGLWRSPFVVFGPLFEPVPGIRLFPWQLLLIALVPVSLASSGAFRHRPRALDTAIFASLLCIVITFLWGWFNGGSPYQAYYQLWRFLTALLVAYVLLSVIRTPRDLRTLAKAIILAAAIRGTLVVYFYWAHIHGKVDPPPAFVTNHDDALLFVTAILIVGSWAVHKGGRAPLTVAILVSLYLFYAMVLNDRRIAWVELLMAMIAIYFLIGNGLLRRRIHRWSVVVVPTIILFVVVGWGSKSSLFAPIQALTSVGSNQDSSSLARQEEVRNLLYTLEKEGNPLLGTGWGLPYQKRESFYSNYKWDLAYYTPHNSLLGLAVFAGLVGIVGIWGVVPVAAYFAASCYRQSTDPTLRTAAMVSAGALVAYSVHCFGDIGLQSFPCGLILGVALAAAGKAAAWSETITLKQPTPFAAGLPSPTTGVSPAQDLV